MQGVADGMDVTGSEVLCRAPSVLGMQGTLI